MAGKSGSSGRTSSKVTNVRSTTTTTNGGNSSRTVHRHENHPFNHYSSSSPSYTSHHKYQQQAHHLHVPSPSLSSSFHSSHNKLNSLSLAQFRSNSPSVKSLGQHSRINSSASLTSYTHNHRSPLAVQLSASPSSSSFQSYTRSPLAATTASTVAPVTCSMFYKNALKNRKNKRTKGNSVRRRDISPAHPSALLSYLRGQSFACPSSCRCE